MAALTARSSFLRNLQIVEYELNSMQVKKSKRQTTNRFAVSRTRSCGKRDADFGLDKHGLRCAIHREGEACKFIRIENDGRRLGRSLQPRAVGRCMVAYRMHGTYHFRTNEERCAEVMNQPVPIYGR